ncbi:MAG: hypothetical protein MCS20_00640 [Candidatus Phytoplasma mali]|nr:hypothetical protein [Candidatus Phytoplasma australiense]MBZ7920009.1 hypothetical protein [Candidatus Karelsulcia muelleri]MCG7201914.1 hypothetical protein [Candidatus Phytoplasma mali]
MVNYHKIIIYIYIYIYIKDAVIELIIKLTWLHMNFCDNSHNYIYIYIYIYIYR